MNQYTVYDKNTGVITKSINCTEEILRININSNEDYINGSYNSDEYYFDLSNNSITRIPNNPNTDFKECYTFNGSIWEENIPLLTYSVTIKRNQLLKDTDWTQLPDVPLATKELWANYRQALRDLTSQEGFPSNIVWPTQPI